MSGEGEVRVDLRHRLLGFRVVESDERHVVIRCPWWVLARVVPAAGERIRAESGLIDRGLRVRTAGKLIRIERA